MEIKNHKLVEESVNFQPSPNVSGNFKEGFPDTVIIHYTAGANAESSAKTLSNPSVKASAHLIIGRGGKIIQLANFKTITWHAGRSSYKGRNGFNQYAIGIEFDNAGAVDKREDGCYYSWFNKKYSEEEVVKAIHQNESKPRYWHAYSEIQIKLAFKICRLLKDTYNIKSILGHEEISPGRKIDPGPAFPLDRLREHILNGRSSDTINSLPESGKVMAKALNIRSGPSTVNNTIALPLKNGEEVTILEEKNGWYRVKTTIEGWVAADYIK